MGSAVIKHKKPLGIGIQKYKKTARAAFFTFLLFTIYLY